MEAYSNGVTRFALGFSTISLVVFSRGGLRAEAGRPVRRLLR